MPSRTLAALAAIALLPFVTLTGAAQEPSTTPPIAAPATRPLLPPTITSGLGVPPGETFHLGERMTGAFTASAKNLGKVAVTILAKRDKRIETVGVVKPGETVVRKFASGDGVLVRNESPETSAKLTVEVWGTRDMAMYYVPNDQDAKAKKEE